MPVASRAVAPAQRSVHALPVLQSRLHELVHVTSHVAVSRQSTLLLGPTVTSQSASMQSTFELSSVVTTQVEPAGQSTLQLPLHM